MSGSVPPIITITSDWSPVERSAVFHLSGLLGQLRQHVELFHSAVALVDYAEEVIGNLSEGLKIEKDWPKRKALMQAFDANPAKHWGQIACRDAAMTMYHFWQTLKAIQFKDCPTLRDMIDHKMLREARRKFDAYFPQVEEARHVVGHSAELTKTPKDTDFNAFTGSRATSDIRLENVTGLMLIGVVESGRRLTTTWADPHTKTSRMVTTECSLETLAKLEEVMNLVFQIFDAAVETARADALKRFQQRDRN